MKKRKGSTHRHIRNIGSHRLTLIQEESKVQENRSFTGLHDDGNPWNYTAQDDGEGVIVLRAALINKE